MAIELTYPGAALAGLLSFASPCVLPLVPPYLCYLAGVSFEEFAAAGGARVSTARNRIITASLAFVLGFTTVFVLLGATASALGRLVTGYSVILSQFAGIVIIIFGLHFLGLFRLRALMREARVEARQPAGPLGAYVMGLAFAFGWTPCIGPVLAAILALAGREESAAKGAALLATYSAGLGLPFILAAAFSGVFLKAAAKLKSRMGLVEKLTGALLVIAGFLFLTGEMSRFAFWLLEALPALGRLG